jgi:hypothetical protein
VLVNQSSFKGAYDAGMTNAHPPLYFALLYYWHFISNSEVMLRLPSVLASTGAAWVAFRWIAMVLGKDAGLIALLLLAFSPVLTALGAEVRNYSVLMLWMTSTLYFLERAFRDQKISSLAYSSLFLYLAILTHYSALWFVLAVGIYGLLRISSLKRNARIAWLLFQLGAAALYAWLYVVQISKLHRSPMEAEAMTGWLRALYFRAGDNVIAFLQHATVDVFHFLFGSLFGGDVALTVFIVAVLWLLVGGVFGKRRDLAAFGLLLLLPFALGMIASVLDFYPYGGTRHCIYLLLFATAGFSFVTAKIVRHRVTLILLLAVSILPYWFLHRLPDPQEMNRNEQRKALMEGAIADLRSSVPPSEPIFSDYQASILLEYYLGRDHPPPPPRECGGVREVQYGDYRVVVVNAWSATSAQLMTGLDGWRKGCGPAKGDSFWIFDAGWGLNVLDDLNQSMPGSTSQAQRFGQTISLFKLRISR